MNIDRFETIYNILDSALYSYELYKSLIPYFKRNDSVFDPYEKEFWCKVSDDCLQIAAIQWTKVFGSEKNNHTHYSTLISPEEFTIHLQKMGIDLKTVSSEMKKFRDKYVAHKDQESFPVPFFAKPIQIIHEFDVKVRENKHNDLCECFNLSGNHDAYKLRIEDYLIKIGILSESD